MGFPWGVSFLMGALYLKLLDDKMEVLGFFRWDLFMDDWVVRVPPPAGNCEWWYEL